MHRWLGESFGLTSELCRIHVSETICKQCGGVVGIDQRTMFGLNLFEDIRYFMSFIRGYNYVVFFFILFSCIYFLPCKKYRV